MVDWGSVFIFCPDVSYETCAQSKLTRIVHKAGNEPEMIYRETDIFHVELFYSLEELNSYLCDNHIISCLLPIIVVVCVSSVKTSAKSSMRFPWQTQ